MPKLLSSLTECSKFPCKNGGLCTDKDDGTYKCSCINGFSGDQCNDLAGKCLDGHLYNTTVKLMRCLFIPPGNEVAGVYSDPYVRPFVRSSVRPSQSLIRYSSKTAEQNFIKLSGIIHYMMPYCTSYFKFLSA